MDAMIENCRKDEETGCLEAPERNRYFHGKMLDVRHFNLETDYHTGKRKLINRLILGWGVVCGLDVRETKDGEGVIVEPGLAIDRWGREIVVDTESPPIPIPPEILARAGLHGDPMEPTEEVLAPGDSGRLRESPNDESRYPEHEPNGHRDDDCETDDGGRPGHRWGKAHLVLCYHECTVEPTPVLAGDCRDEEPCQSGVIRERYTLEIRPGCLPIQRPRLAIADVIDSEGNIDYRALVREVSAACPCSKDPCIPLANIHVGRHGDPPRCRQKLDTTVRPIVFTNDLLFQLILSAVIEAPSYRSGK